MNSQIPKNTENSVIPRPPVVVVLGHVDHGKTSILDYIRKTKIAEKESGGITQHIGAYEIEHPSASSGQVSKITFIDTPGHEAFSAMRMRGTKVADIAILVVAADEEIKPQTKEAILDIKKTGILMVVAINKIDKPQADPAKVKRELQQNDVLVESMSGKTPSVEISAKTGQGIPELLEIILLLAEMAELKGDIKKPGEGVVVEAFLDSQSGPTATLLLRDGILRVGDIVATRSTLGKIKILENFQRKPQEKALPSMPCVVIGFEKVPQVGEKFEVYPDTETAKSYIEKKERKSETGEVFVIDEKARALNLILKADVRGSLEAIAEVLKSLPQKNVILRILKAEVGEIQETDIRLAQNSKARVIGFRVKVNSIAAKLAERDNIQVITFDIIYELAQGVRALMEKRLSSEKIRQDLGKLKVLIVFLTEKNRQIVGGKMFEGEIRKGVSIEVLRKETIVGKGRLINLQKNKKDIEKAVRGDECGILYEGDVKIEQGDILQIYETKSARQSID